MISELSLVIAHLDSNPVSDIQTWQDWHIIPVIGGANNLLYRVTHSNGDDYAVKFTVRDDRDRAGREYAALLAIAEAGTPIAPHAVWLEQTRYQQPVVVQTWLAGSVLTEPPASDADWENLLTMYCHIHSITPAHTSVSLADATLNVATAIAGKQLIAQHLARIPEYEQPRSLRPIVRWLERWTPPTWSTPPRTLCRVDSNWRNFLQRPHEWVSVDWENSGWGDPAFEWADILTHPAYADVRDAPWEQLIASYGERMHDSTAARRIETYTHIMQIWWVVRWARYLYEVPRGLDPRLVERPATWVTEATAQYERYVAQAEQAIGQLG